MLSMKLEVDMGRNCLVEHMDNSSMVECMIDISLEVGMGRSFMVLVGILNYSMKMGYMDSKQRVESLRWNSH